MYLRSRDVVKFGFAVGFAAIFIDASIAHGLFWDNDPYWTYWITKTFLITTVFTLGTAFGGVGILQGLVLTAIHTLVLEVYYQWLAPVGLPQEPEWLDFNHLWTTGVPAHYLAILGGYLLVLWIWRRNSLVPRESGAGGGADADARLAAMLALAAALVILLLDGLLTQGVLLQKFPGLTFFVQHLLIGFVFLYAWGIYVGFDLSGWIVGSVMLSLVWTTYSMYLGPQGLPTEPPTYLGYDDLWTKSFPGGFVAALAGLGLTTRFIRPALLRLAARLPAHPVAARVPAQIAMLFILLFLAPAATRADEGLPASASASGHGMMVVGPDPVDMKSTQPMDGSIKISVIEMGNRWSHVQNTDIVNVVAEFTAGESKYHVNIDKSMPRHPLGKYTTWSGVVYGHEMHGATGIGTGKLPKMKPKIALYGWAEVTRDGKVIAKMAPAHVMVTTEGPMKGVMLEVDTEEKTLLGTPDGYINVMWHEVGSLDMPEFATQVRQWVGWTVLLVLVVGFWVLAVGSADVKTRSR